ncbi:hypothetical protein D3C81_908750 [compost metagenome]
MMDMSKRLFLSAQLQSLLQMALDVLYAEQEIMKLEEEGGSAEVIAKLKRKQELLEKFTRWAEDLDEDQKKYIQKHDLEETIESTRMVIKSQEARREHMRTHLIW